MKRDLEEGIWRAARNYKLIKIELVRVAKAIAEGKMMELTVADLNRLIRLEEFLREDMNNQETKIVLCWSEYDEGAECDNGSED